MTVDYALDVLTMRSLHRSNLPTSLITNLPTSSSPHRAHFRIDHVPCLGRLQLTTGPYCDSCEPALPQRAPKVVLGSSWPPECRTYQLCHSHANRMFLSTDISNIVDLEDIVSSPDSLPRRTHSCSVRPPGSPLCLQRIPADLIQEAPQR